MYEVTKKGVAIYEGEFQECYDFLVNEFKYFTLSELQEIGIKLSPA